MFELPIPHTVQTKNACGQCALRGCICVLTPYCPALKDMPFMDQTFSTVDEMYRIGNHYGLPLALETGVTLGWIRNKIASGVPVILLGAYSYLNPPHSFSGNHWFCAKGFDENGFKINDSLRSQPVYASNATLEASLAHVVASIDNKPVTHLAMYPSEASLMPKPKGLGHNVQPLYIADFPGYLNLLRDNPPPAIVCVESPARAQLIMQTLKPLGTDVIYREYDGVFTAQAMSGFNWYESSLEQLEAHYATLPANGASPKDRAIAFAMIGYDPEIPETIEQHAAIIEASKRMQAQASPKSDDNAQNNYTPQQWADINAPYAAMGFTTHANNEPNFNPETIEWLLAIAWICVQRGWRCVLGNWSVGTPPENEWHKAEALLRYVAQHRNLLSIGLHEYTAHLTTLEFGKITDPAQFPTISPNTKPYLMGRFRWMLDYCKAQGFKAPNIVFTEWGYDTIHAVINWQSGLPGYQHGAGYQICKPYWQTVKPVGWTLGRYAARQLGWIWKELYQKHPEVKGACFFCSDGAGAWHTNFRIVGENDLFSAIKEYEDFSVNTETTVDTYPITLGSLTGSINVRATANGAIVGQLVRGDVFVPSTQIERAGSYWWRKGTSEKHGVVWMAVRTLSGTPVAWDVRLTP